MIPDMKLLTFSQREQPMTRQFSAIVSILTVFLVLLSSRGGYSQGTTLSADNPLSVDMKERSVSILAYYNGKHPEPTHHGIVSRTGKLYRKAFFVAFADPKAFHDALLKAGLTPGNNMTMDNMEKTFVKGDLLDVSVSWKGGKRSYGLDELVRDSNGKSFAVRFGGNLALAVKKNTGCLLCLDSCPVGITSNSNYMYGAIDNRKDVKFTAVTGLMPTDGMPVVIKFKPKK